MQSEISEHHMVTSTHFALFIIFIEHQCKRVLKQKINKNCSFLTMTMHCTSNLLGRKKKNLNELTIERGKIWIPFIKLGVRPTSTQGPRRGQLIST
jgi:hypothetical protein